MKKTTIAIITLIIISFIIAIYVYPIFPEEVASHWNSKGEVNGYMPKFWGIFLMPLMSLFMFGLFLFLPKLDPLKKNVKKFKGFYNEFILFMIVFFFYVFILTILYNLEIIFNMTYAILPAIAILFYFIGVLLEKSKRNWFIGIKTPWTLSSDYVWDKTHKLGSRLFKIIAALVLIGLFYPDQGIVLFIIPLIAMVIWLYVYSYVVYKKEKSK
jgi:uncharacterized membrane protein